MKQLEIFNYRGYGDYGCSKCNAPLIGKFTAIGEVSDEEGYAWRSFCLTCAASLNIDNKFEVDSYIEELYDKYPDAPLLSE